MSSSQPQTSSPWFHTVLLAIVLVVLSPFIIVFLIIALLPWLKVRYIERPRLLRRIKNEWLPIGKTALVVYSDNPAWKEYIFTTIIPRLGNQAELLNWSEYAQWKNSDTLAVALFKNFTWGTHLVPRRRTRSGAQEFNHQVIVFKPWNEPTIVNFLKEFRQHELGNDGLLKECENKIFKLLEPVN